MANIADTHTVGARWKSSKSRAFLYRHAFIKLRGFYFIIVLFHFHFLKRLKKKKPSLKEIWLLRCDSCIVVAVAHCCCPFLHLYSHLNVLLLSVSLFWLPYAVYTAGYKLSGIRLTLNVSINLDFFLLLSLFYLNSAQNAARMQWVYFVPSCIHVEPGWTNILFRFQWNDRSTQCSVLVDPAVNAGHNEIKFIVLVYTYKMSRWLNDSTAARNKICWIGVFWA